ncbi:ATP-binding protein [Corallococcus sp. Z5C101001]|uniref:ATP-binding protein n=1 Tax=Corallococcus sp. Z5C101001 TaxID=2596829 RepID=UPI001180EC27|nr:ATP-binding protein [Corallococcus sp. Z5C101001]TSC32931.1 ATP-binding protein [Corallococcus sp. Z5C101001]
MSPSRADSWQEANQRQLTAALGVVRARIARHASLLGVGLPEGTDDVDTALAALAEAEVGIPAPPALESLCQAFRLSPFERDILLCCVSLELGTGFGALFASVNGDPRKPWPTFGMALASLPEAHWSALTPVAPLRRWELVSLAPGEGLTSCALRIDERVLHHLVGLSYLDRRLQEFMAPVPPPRELPVSHQALAERLRQPWERAPDVDEPMPLVQLCGLEPDGAQAIASAACASLGLQLHVTRATQLPAGAEERAALARWWEREALLLGSGLLLECDEATGADALRAATAFAERVQGVVIVSSRESLRPRSRAAIHLEVKRPTRVEQRLLWTQALGPEVTAAHGALERITTQFDLPMRSIRAAGSDVREQGPFADEGALGAALWAACRVQSRPQLEELAQRIEPTAGWEDLVMPPEKKAILREIAASVRQRARVYETWGFASKGMRGLGISALFSGASGTGKTMAAEVLALELGLDLYRIDLSQVVSKYIGETEKNLRRVFDAAQEGGAILLFDEADALFGKRTEVRDSHDRYANIEVSYLLQQMESYGGLAILTTNMKDALDTAFLRRLRFVLQFPFPDAPQRTEIWRRMFPAATPTEGLDMARLARLSVTGGNIRTIALNAAFLAADAGEPVRMAHLQRAVRSEFSKLDKPLAEAEVSGWT